MTIMTYESFKQLVVRNIKNYLPEKYEKWEIRESVVRKINEKMDCINLIPAGDDTETTGVFPNVYLNFFYKKMMEGFSFEYIMQAIAVLIDGSTPPIEIVNVTDMQQDIIPTVINRGKNSQLVDKMPHRDFLDLTVIYRIAVATEDAGVYGCNITYDIMDEFGLTEEELFKLAFDNMERKFPLKIRNLGQQMKRMMEEEGMDIEKSEAWSPLFVITNDQHFFGASGILKVDMLRKVSDVFDEDLYVIPSSIHEILVLPKSLGSYSSLKEIIKEANTDAVEESEWLSDNLYVYNRAENSVEISMQN